MTGTGTVGSHTITRHEGLSRLRTTHQFYRSNQTLPAHLAYQWMTHKLLQALLENRSHLFRMGEQIHFFHQLQIAKRYRRANRMAGIRKTVGKVPQLSGSIRKGFVHEFRQQHCADWQVGR